MQILRHFDVLDPLLNVVQQAHGMFNSGSNVRDHRLLHHGSFQSKITCTVAVFVTVAPLRAEQTSVYIVS